MNIVSIPAGAPFLETLAGALVENPERKPDGTVQQQFLVYETKGSHLVDLDDAQYKQKVLNQLEASLADGNELNDPGVNYGEMSIARGDPSGVFRIVLDGDFRRAVAGTYADPSPTST